MTRTIILAVIGLVALGGVTLLGHRAFEKVQQRVDAQQAHFDATMKQQREEEQQRRDADDKARVQREQNDAAVVAKQAAAAEKKRSDEHADAQRRIEELRKQLENVRKRDDGLDDALRGLQAKVSEVAANVRAGGEANVAKVAALERQLTALRFPPLAEGETPVFTIAFESTGPLTVERGDRKHLALFLEWREPREKPADAILEAVNALYQETGTKLEKRVLLQGAKRINDRWEFSDNPTEAVSTWYVAWTREKNDKSVILTHVEVYGDRVRVRFYGGRASDEGARAVARTRLLQIAKAFDLTAGSRSDWSPSVDGYTDLYLRP